MGYAIWYKQLSKTNSLSFRHFVQASVLQVTAIVKLLWLLWCFSYKQAYLNLTFLGFYDQGKSKSHLLWLILLKSFALWIVVVLTTG